MALTLAGYSTNKRRAQALFGAKPGWSGASHADISLAVQKATGSPSGEWTHWIEGSMDVRAWLLDQRAGHIAGSIIATAFCRHRKYDITCGHAFVLSGLDDRGLLMLDPLSRAPRHNETYNVILDARSTSNGLLVTQGADWDILIDRQVSVLPIAHSRANFEQVAGCPMLLKTRGVCQSYSLR
jgi:hypothetical protein